MAILADITPLRRSPAFRRLWWGQGCIDSCVRPDLVLQAIDAARCEGKITEATAERQRRELREGIR